MSPAIVIKDLVTHYGGRLILDNINLTIENGETVAILGQSGCGKTTLLRHIMGLHRPTSGEIYIKGKNIFEIDEEEYNEIKKRMGVLFQSGALFNSMTVGDNVALPLREHTKLDESIIKIMIRMKLKLVGLSGFEHLMPNQISGGMKKRAGLARALAMDPEILLCDEPSAGLDPIIAAGIDNLILQLDKVFKMTIIVVTHEIKSAFTVANKIVMLFKGKVISIGKPDEIKNSDDSYIRQFLAGIACEEEYDAETYLDSLMYD